MNDAENIRKLLLSFKPSTHKLLFIFIKTQVHFKNFCIAIELTYDINNIILKCNILGFKL